MKNLILHSSAVFANYCIIKNSLYITRTKYTRTYNNLSNWLIHQYKTLFHDDLKRINKSQKENKWIIFISNKTLKQKNKFSVWKITWPIHRGIIKPKQGMLGSTKLTRDEVKEGIQYYHFVALCIFTYYDVVYNKFYVCV